MNLPGIPDLSFPRIPTGSHGMKWDLRVFLYRGAAAIERRMAFSMIDRGELGVPLVERVPLLIRIHEVIQRKLESGGMGAAATAASDIGNLARFVAWVDREAMLFALERLIDVYLAWVESLVRGYQVDRCISHRAAYSYAVRMSDIVGRVLGAQSARPGRAVLRQTRMRSPYVSPRWMVAKADKQSLDKALAFGTFLTDICEALTVDVIRGSLPIRIYPRAGSPIVVKGYVKQSDETPKAFSGKSRARAQRIRAPLALGASLMEERPTVLNARIEAELAIFAAQTGMNLTQAARLRHEQYRWQTDGDEVRAFRVYKGRRGGEAIFQCFKAYRAHLQKYLAWLEEAGLRKDDERLFPFIYHKRVIPAAFRVPRFGAIQTLCCEAGIAYIAPQSLRKTRINWLMRRTRDPTLTAAMAAHTKETLLRQYEEPHFQTVVVEITRFHRNTDATLTPSSGDGLCARLDGEPSMIRNCPQEAPKPDCISPEGCLFCTYHRDVMTLEYCWKLASHARLKTLETTLYRPPKSPSNHPAIAVVERIEAKLRSIAESGRLHADWVRDARDAIRSEHYHPAWEGHIQSLEALLARA